jgi:hypothetical protein
MKGRMAERENDWNTWLCERKRRGKDHEGEITLHREGSLPVTPREDYLLAAAIM